MSDHSRGSQHGLHKKFNENFVGATIDCMNTIYLWHNDTRLDAAKFYAEAFPDSVVGAVLRTPSNYPVGKLGKVLTYELTVMDIPYLGQNGG